VLDAQALPRELDASRPLLIFQMDRPALASEVKLSLLESYPEDHPLTCLRALGVAAEEELAVIPLVELDRRGTDHLTTVYVPPLPPEKRKPTFADLVALMGRLRSESGCPWDREQDHRSLRGALLEESYEALEAIDRGEPEALCQELGDLLLQVLFHAQLGKEEGYFDIGDVIRGLRDKLVGRHPHVFGGARADSAAEVLHQWERRKRNERGESVAEQMRNCPKALPALARAAAVLRRAVRAGFAWPDFGRAWQKFEEEEAEFLRAAEAPGQEEELDRELGDVLMTLCSLAGMKGIDPEQALREAVDRFIERFRSLEARTEGRPLEEFPLEELLSLWRETAR
jgi:tetrapyrrole methylase family protein/MazG family protein